MNQQMLISKDVLKHTTNFAQICAKIVNQCDLDILFGSEIGGFRGGCRRVVVVVEHVLAKPFVFVKQL